MRNQTFEGLKTVDLLVEASEMMMIQCILTAFIKALCNVMSCL